jgi:GntR family transcriptional repressor for pyruvate dehydrogenase complex
MIINKELKFGDKLPLEREMSENFGVSRASVREALKALK